MTMSRFGALFVLVALLALPCGSGRCFAQDDEAEAAAEKDDAADDAEESSDDEATDEKESEEDAEEEDDAEPTKVRLAYMVLDKALPESADGGSPFSELLTDLRTTISRIDKAAKDDKIDGLVLDLQGPPLGYGQINELRQAVARFRAADKKVYAFMETGSTPDYLVAAACNEIVMPESGYMVVPGVRSEAMFYKGMFDLLGVKADFIHMGEAKGAAEPYTRERHSPPVRENLTALVDHLYQYVIDTIDSDRPLTREQAIEIVDRGLLTAGDAEEAGIIDRVAYADEFKAQLTEAYEADELVYVMNYGKQEVDTDFSGPTGFFKLLKLLSGAPDTDTARGKKIAVVYAVGPIMSGKSQSDLFGSSTLGSATIVEALRDANDDEDVAAVVLRIDSPGGSAVASDMMWRQIQELDKPIVASMGDVAASGGYYIAMGCDKIVAEPGTITGSIGVVGGKIAMKGLYDRLGLEIDVIARGKNSDLFSSTKRFSPTGREALQQMMEETYEQFTSKAAEGRDMPIEQLKKLAGGRVYTGVQAKQNGLIDELGTLHDAIEEAKKLAKLDADEEVKIETLPEPVDFFESLFGDNSAEKEVSLALPLQTVSPELAGLARKAQSLQRVFREPVVLMMPFELEIK